MGSDKILVVTDNGIMLQRFMALVSTYYSQYENQIKFKCSKSYHGATGMYSAGIENLQTVDVKLECDSIIQSYALIISLHCKQVFPTKLVNSIRCINVHPGYNPNNRGWYPQVFAIAENTIIGATVHEMNEKIDGGKIIFREAVDIQPYDTSKEVYEKVVDMEIEILRNHLGNIIEGNYHSFFPKETGHYRSVGDFNKLCNINLNQQLTMKQAIDKLRALSHGDYKNGYFITEKGEKIFVKIILTKDGE